MLSGLGINYKVCMLQKYWQVFKLNNTKTQSEVVKSYKNKYSFLKMRAHSEFYAEDVKFT